MHRLHALYSTLAPHRTCLSARADASLPGSVAALSPSLILVQLLSTGAYISLYPLYLTAHEHMLCMFHYGPYLHVHTLHTDIETLHYLLGSAPWEISLVQNIEI